MYSRIGNTIAVCWTCIIYKSLLVILDLLTLTNSMEVQRELDTLRT